MKAIRIELPPELHEYLLNVLTKYSRGQGFDGPEEGMVLFHTWDFLAKRAQVVELEGPRVATTAPQPRVPNDGVSPLQRGDVEAAVPPTIDEPQHSDGS